MRRYACPLLDLGFFLKTPEILGVVLPSCIQVAPPDFHVLAKSFLNQTTKIRGLAAVTVEDGGAACRIAPTSARIAPKPQNAPAHETANSHRRLSQQREDMGHTSVYGIYATRQDAEVAIDSMRASGFSAQDISVLFPDNEGTKDIGHEKHTKAPEKATAGAAIAGIAGGTIGWLVGIGAIAIPGVGPLVAAGPIMAALAGLGAGSVVGGLAGALIGMGIPEYEAKRYEGRIRKGGILLSVHCDNDLMVSRAKEMLRHTGAEDIAAADEGKVRGHARDTVVEEHPTTTDTRRVKRTTEEPPPTELL